MAKTKKTETPALEQPVSTTELVNALVQAIQLTKPVEKRNAINRKPGSPWDPKDGSKKPKLKRKMYQHGILMDAEILSVEEIELCNKLKVGRFFGDWVKVYRRKDHGIDIDYPVKTNAQRIKSAGLFRGDLAVLLRGCIEEAARPKPVENLDDED